MDSTIISHPTWEQYFMSITLQVAERATCSRGKVGAVLVRNRNILATGYNGTPAGMPHCIDDGIGCQLYKSIDPTGFEDVNCFRVIHAEINAISQAAKNGMQIVGANLYCTHSPCVHCMKVLVNMKVEEIFYLKEYRIESIRELMKVGDIYLTKVWMPEKQK